MICLPTPRFHDCFIVMSDAKGSDGEPLCHFHQSSLWYRRIVPDVPLLPNSEHVVPDLNRVPGPLSKSQRHKQAISGDKMYLKIMKTLWKGMPAHCTSAPVCYIDLFAYDTQLKICCMHVFF